MELRIPSPVVRNQNARLECHFDLDDETLYSVKWYKDGNEFYRYVPRDMPPAQVFPLPGVTVDVRSLHIVLLLDQYPAIYDVDLLCSHFSFYLKAEPD